MAHRLLLPADQEDAEALEAERKGSPEDYVLRVTQAKWRAAVARLARYRQRDTGGMPAAILCADTTVALGNTIWANRAMQPAAANPVLPCLAQSTVS